MKLPKLISSTLLAGIITSCNFMDYDDSHDLKGDYVFSRYDYATRLVTEVYTCLPGGFNAIDGAMYSSATDEAEHSYDQSSIQTFNNGSWNKYSNPDDKWSFYYDKIRKANLYLEETTELPQLIYDEYRWSNPGAYFSYKWNLYFFEGEIHFLRAFCYFELMKRYGDIPLVTQNIDPNGDTFVPRSPVKDIIKQISSDCRKAASIVLENWNVKINYDGEIATEGELINLEERSGRATKGAAYALLSKAFLYAASPLHNNGEYDLALCDSAAKYAAIVMDMPQYDFEPQYADLFKTGTSLSKELIFERRNANSNSFEKSNYPVSIDGAGAGATCPSQNLAEAYEMSDGSKFDWNKPEHAANPFSGREPRFNATFLCNGESSFGGHIVETWDDGADGKNKERGTLTGYYLRKYVDPNLNLVENKTSRHTWYLIRLADIYLMFAEAANEINGPTATLYGHTAKEAINAVRNRVSLPEITTTDKMEFRNKLRHERRVELAFEDARYWDVRRWQIGESCFGSDIYGLHIETDNGILTYSRRKVESRVYKEYMDLYPIPESEILKTGWQQNAGW